MSDESVMPERSGEPVVRVEVRCTSQESEPYQSPSDVVSVLKGEIVIGGKKSVRWAIQLDEKLGTPFSSIVAFGRVYELQLIEVPQPAPASESDSALTPK